MITVLVELHHCFQLLKLLILLDYVIGIQGSAMLWLNVSKFRVRELEAAVNRYVFSALYYSNQVKISHGVRDLMSNQNPTLWNQFVASIFRLTKRRIFHIKWKLVKQEPKLKNWIFQGATLIQFWVSIFLLLFFFFLTRWWFWTGDYTFLRIKHCVRW